MKRSRFCSFSVITAVSSVNAEILIFTPHTSFFFSILNIVNDKFCLLPSILYLFSFYNFDVMHLISFVFFFFFVTNIYYSSIFLTKFQIYLSKVFVVLKKICTCWFILVLFFVINLRTTIDSLVIFL